MYKPFEIKENLFYVGVNDRTKHLFENLLALAEGEYPTTLTSLTMRRWL